jgi:uncharacterized protein
VTRAAAGVVGVVFGFTLAWSGMSDPDVIRAGLLLEDAYLFLFFFAAMATALVGVQLLRRSRVRALITREPIELETLRPERRHVFGSALFGLGWAVSAACPGPVAAQLGQGVLWSLATIAGIVIGLKLHAARART